MKCYGGLLYLSITTLRGIRVAKELFRENKPSFLKEEQVLSINVSIISIIIYIAKLLFLNIIPYLLVTHPDIVLDFSDLCTTSEMMNPEVNINPWHDGSGDPRPTELVAAM